MSWAALFVVAGVCHGQPSPAEGPPTAQATLSGVIHIPYPYSVKTVELSNALLTVSKAVPTLPQQALVRRFCAGCHGHHCTPSAQVGLAVDPAAGSASIINTRSSRAHLVVANVERVVAPPVDNSLLQIESRSAITGLLNSTIEGMPRCPAYLGTSSRAFTMQTGIWQLLRVECPSASTLKLENKGGSCLQVSWARAARIEAYGNRSIVVFPDPARLPAVIDVGGMTSWGPPGRSPANTRVIVRLSELQSDGNRIGVVEIRGRLPYVVPDGAFGVVVAGCGTNKFRCLATDKNGKPTCRFTERCTSSVATAKANIMAAISTRTPCVVPPP